VTDSLDLAAKGGGGSLRSTKTPEVAPADEPFVCRDCIGSAALCLPVHAADVAACASVVGRDAAGAGPTDGRHGTAGDGTGRGAALRALPSGAQSGALVGVSRGADSAGASDRAVAVAGHGHAITHKSGDLTGRGLDTARRT
jgi:hypothetical protein